MFINWNPKLHFDPNSLNLEDGLADLPSEAKSLHGALNVFEQGYLPLLGSALGSSDTGQQDVATDTSKFVEAMARFGASGPAFDTSMFTGSHNEPGQQAMLAVHGHHGSLDLGDIAFGNGEKKETIKELQLVRVCRGISPQGDAFTDVKGSWIVPSVSGNTNQTAYSVTWIGIDGYSSNTVEQIGTEQDWINGSAGLLCLV